MKNFKIFISQYIKGVVSGIYGWILAVFCLCLFSCEKMLEVETPSNQIGKDKVFVDVQTANAALAGLYAGLRDNSPLSGEALGPFLGVYTDDLDSYALTDTNGVLALYHNQQTDTNSTVYSIWSTAYQHIYAANAIIEGVRASALPAEDKNRIEGEALLIRSILLFYLQQIFGASAYPISTDYTVNQSLSRVEAGEVLTRLETDLSRCIQLLSDGYRDVERIFPNRKVAELMLAKVYMLEQKWSHAEGILKTITASPLYSFQNDLAQVFQKNSGHILWQLKPAGPGDPTKEAMLYYFSAAAPTNYALSENLIGAFSSGDLRKQSWMVPVTVNGKTWYRAGKYKNTVNNDTEDSVVFRLEEVYLLLAETLAQQNKTGEALQHINPVKQRAGLSPLASVSKEMLLDEILLENRREFFTEMGHRFLDLKRNGRLGDLQDVKPGWKAFHSLWPVPQKDLLLNPNLKPQNNGY
ncbi:RagB/SusD family nutrient uptake outer membrane protein [Chryseobacterium sp. RP-3-3]|uniref:RagB/SusD family nutrient uptake outer membrane protein n=1 Tax=Chryseobacterium antibioticum TaxID=2728847 RepID=A0A7Y0FU22_9FLAO|nr:RagB/SusD family nutrient uptake outer membrane protein [Chryseobacterium antibioticum]NML72435.1 RagB/SusD family nutrient uptake outer membrane protein [Chryseobacterium antibioticum]